MLFSFIAYRVFCEEFCILFLYYMVPKTYISQNIDNLYYKEIDKKENYDKQQE